MNISAQSYTSSRQISPDIKVITDHSSIILGKKVNYEAQVGTQPIWNSSGDTIYATLHYTLYKRKDIEDDSNRPLVFSFNGGPGAASVWLHMGYTGPYNLIVDDEGYPIQPYGFKTNPYSILDVADIVFVNPVNVGYSRILGKLCEEDDCEEKESEMFFGVNQDINYLAEWISTFVSRQNRWSSPKYLIGESYGGVRVMGLAHELQQNHWLYLNGVILVSPADYEYFYSDGDVIQLIGDFPYLSATAWYHKKLKVEYQSMDLEKLI